MAAINITMNQLPNKPFPQMTLSNIRIGYALLEAACAGVPDSKPSKSKAVARFGRA